MRRSASFSLALACTGALVFALAACPAEKPKSVPVAVDTTPLNLDSVKTAIPPDVRQVIVRQLGAALAEAWRRQSEIPSTNDERPDCGSDSAGRNARGDGGHEQHADYHEQS